ncbi:MAG TPA: hypothetical protein VN833_12460 [Candidatus Acidoferrales bacterium]|nr:hypothetical protein [Candidatus Acidoferrales bacterium]
MIAFQKNLVASANAHHLVADFVEARGGIAGAEESEDKGAEQEGLQSFEAWLASLRFSIRVCHYTFTQYLYYVFKHNVISAAGKTAGLRPAGSRGELPAHLIQFS